MMEVCQINPNNATDLLDSTEGLQRGWEWQYVQNAYGRSEMDLGRKQDGERPAAFFAVYNIWWMVCDKNTEVCIAF
jgi:hypothetical protein